MCFDLISDCFLSLEQDTSVCDSFTINATQGFEHYLWNTGENTQTIDITQSGNYSVQVANTPTSNHSLYINGNQQYVEILGTEEDNIGQWYNGNGINQSVDPKSFTVAAWVKVEGLVNGEITIVEKSDDWTYNSSTSQWEGLGESWRLALSYPDFKPYASLTPHTNSLSSVWPPGIASGGTNDCNTSNWSSPSSSAKTYLFSPSAISLNTWYYIAFTWDPFNEEITLYVDGIQVAQETFDTPSNCNALIFPSLCNISIGNKPSSLIPNQALNSSLYIDDVAVWDTSLTAYQLNHYMSCPPIGTSIDMIGFWDFENLLDTNPNNTYNQVFDKSLNNHNGVFNNGASISLDVPYSTFDNSCIEWCDSDDINVQIEVCGCTDPNAVNFNTNATSDDGSCNYCVYGCTDPQATNWSPNATCEDGSCYTCDISFENPLIIPASGGICVGVIAVTATSQYSDIYYSWDNGNNGQYLTGLCQGVYIATATDEAGCVAIQNFTVPAYSSTIFGCTDQSAINYNADANEDDGNCEFDGNACDITPTGLFVDNIIDQRVVFNWESPSSAPSYYMIRYRAVGTSSWTVMSAGPQNDVPFEGTSRTRYFMEANTTYQWNIRARDIDQNGTTICQSPWSASHQYTTLPACENMQELTVSAEANWVTFTADAPSGDWGVWQSKGKIREIGTNSFRYVNGSNSINVLKGNFKTATDYEWHTKAWCTGNVDSDGNSDPMYHSGWGDFSSFSTEDACDKLPTNLSTGTNNNQNAIVMNWDTPDSGAPDHYFLELTNETTGQLFQWNNIAGNSNSKTKFGQTTGNDYSWRIRGACGTNGISWATSFTSPAYYTLGAQRIDGNTISSLEVFPNPSKGLFSISFESKESQNIEISITNYLGEKVFKQEVSNLINTYNRTIDLSNKSNGIYLLSIKTNNKIFNKKIVIQ
jgi:hypothetical protein